jgi:hypothetical protein
MPTIMSLPAIDIEEFAECVHGVQQTFDQNLRTFGPYVFTTKGPLLFSSYVNSFKADKQKVAHNCRACADFIERSGRLAFIDADGNIVPALWNEKNVKARYRPSVKALHDLVSRSKIETKFFTQFETLGRPIDGGFKHLHVKHTNQLLIVPKDPEAFQAMALEDHRNLTRSLADFNVTLVRRVLKLIKDETLKNERLIERHAEWLKNIYVDLARADVKRANRENIVWRYVAAAPVNWCAVRGSILGALLKDLRELDESEAISNFAERTKGDKYQRPQAAPSEGNVQVAERLIAELGIENSLKRRYCGISEYPKVWEPKPAAQTKSGGGVFGHLETKNSQFKKLAVELDNEPSTATVMTWSKFVAKILPDVLTMQFHVPEGKHNFGGVLTALYPDAPPIYKWDRDDNRNPTSMYVYNKGSRARDWSLIAGDLVDVLAIGVMPWQVSNYPYPQYGEGVIIALAGAQDTNNSGLCLFPQDLIGALHPIRATVEAFSESGALAECPEDQSMSGIMLRDKGPCNITLRVVTDLGVSVFEIDRWD